MISVYHSDQAGTVLATLKDLCSLTASLY